MEDLMTNVLQHKTVKNKGVIKKQRKALETSMFQGLFWFLSKK